MKLTMGHKVAAASIIGASAAVAGAFALAAVANQAEADTATTTSITDGSYVNYPDDTYRASLSPRLVEKENASGEGSADVRGTAR